MRYARLQRALLNSDSAANAKVLQHLHEFLEDTIPTMYDQEAYEAYLDKHGFSVHDAHRNAKILITLAATRGVTAVESVFLGLARVITYEFANRRDEYAQRLLNSTFVTTTCGLPGVGPEGVRGFQKGDKIVFFRKLPQLMAVRPCEDGSGAYRFVGIVEMKGMIGGSLWNRAEIKNGRPRLYKIR